MERLRVLLVEDDEDDYILTRQLLAEIGESFELDWEPSFEGAVESIRQQDFDIGLFDYRLGARTGLELLLVAAQLRPTSPVILLTGQGDLEIDIEAMRMGAADYLVKGTLDAAQLERSIRYAVQGRRMEEERYRRVREQEARIQAEAANRAKDEFLATVSHELRSPLNAVLGWVRLLASGKLDAPGQERALAIIERNARSQVQLIDDLLDHARITSGTLRLERCPVELEPIVQKTLEALLPEAVAKSIRLSLHTGEAPVWVDGDAGRLQQIVANLLGNALKFTPEGGEVEVSLAENDGFACLSVRDNGRGIPNEHLPRIFDRFHQALDEPGAPRSGGLGLGLAIALHLAEGHDGTIQVESPGEGQGATFTVRLPIL